MDLFTVFFIIFLILISVGLFVCFADCDVTLLICDYFFNKIDHRGQVVWITGASSGIGEYLAYAFAEQHAKLALSGVNVERLENAKKTCYEKYKSEEGDIILVPFSIDNFEKHEPSLKQVLDHFGHIDILINNAGVSQRADFQDIDITVDQTLFNVNVFGTVNLTRLVLKHFLERGKGHFVVTSSLAGKIGAPFSSAYTGSKHALHGYFECLRTEVCQKNIDVTIACPGPVFSRLTDRCVTGRLEETYEHTQQPTDRKMKTERCSQLMLTAISNKLEECWICQQPLLMIFYFAQYLPSVYRRILLKRFFNEKMVMKLRQGR